MVTGDHPDTARAIARTIGLARAPQVRTGDEIARMVLLDDNFASIVSAIEEGRAVYDNVRKFLTYILTSNVPEIVPYPAFVLARVPLPLTVVQILAVDLGTDILPALAALAVYFFVLDAGGWGYGESLGTRDPLYLEATTACLATIVLMQIANVFLCRDPLRSLASFSLRSNALIVWGIAAELGLLLAITYTPWGQALFGTAALPADVWIYALPFAAAMLALEETRKWIVRARQRRARLAPPAGAGTSSTGTGL